MSGIRRRRVKAGIAAAIVLGILAIVIAVVAGRAAPILKGRIAETLSTRFDSRVELESLQVSVLRGLEVSGHGHHTSVGERASRGILSSGLQFKPLASQPRHCPGYSPATKPQIQTSVYSMKVRVRSFLHRSVVLEEQLRLRQPHANRLDSVAGSSNRY